MEPDSRLHCQWVETCVRLLVERVGRTQLQASEDVTEASLLDCGSHGMMRVHLLEASSMATLEPATTQASTSVQATCIGDR